ncbi:hypothetical protein [Halobacteriovorax sp. BALOs_7]|uniref:hypothetical protein n=1 Tax=Halobacteriovorax sp. BALOs_7 TaxID=2109558 RepID=UPI0013C4986E|nr:hypothetical protein [Halobacteriovorax sp. BALOs_7]
MDAMPAPHAKEIKLIQQAGFKPGFVASGAMGKKTQRKSDTLAKLKLAKSPVKKNRHFHEVKMSQIPRKEKLSLILFLLNILGAIK